MHIRGEGWKEYKAGAVFDVVATPEQDRLQPGEVDRLHQIRDDMFIVARLFSNQLGQPRGDGTPKGPAAGWPMRGRRPATATTR